MGKDMYIGFKKIEYKLINILGRYPGTCRIEKSSKRRNVSCTGYNLIGKRARLRNVEMGYASGISEDSIVEETKIGKYTALAPRLRIIRGEHPVKDHVSIHPAFYSTMAQYGFTYVKRQSFDEFRYADVDRKYGVIIGNDVWIGADVIIVEGVTIGDGAIVAAGSVVTKNIPPYAIVGGNPAKLIRYRFESDEIDFLMKLQWWNKTDAWIEKHSNAFANVKDLQRVLELEDADSNSSDRI